MARDKVGVVKRLVDASNRRDVDRAFAELVTPDFELHPAIVGALHGAVCRGREGVERFAADTRENWEEFQNVAAEFRGRRASGRGSTRRVQCVPGWPAQLAASVSASGAAGVVNSFALPLLVPVGLPAAIL
jgi:hypothetical protein